MSYIDPIVAANTARMSDTGVYLSPKAQVVRMIHQGQPVFFTIANPNDVIQSEHVAGRFYEPEELAIIAKAFPRGGRFLDIGANVGNHAVYVAKFLGASRVVLVEPNPVAIAILESNIFLNGLQDICDRSRLGYGLSDGTVDTASIRAGKNNLGKGRIKEGDGDIPMKSGDELLGDEEFDLIKIDVEGLEMKVLEGLSGYLRRKPTQIFIEVDRENYEAFDAWLDANDYAVLDRFQRYRTNTNFMISAKR